MVDNTSDSYIKVLKFLTKNPPKTLLWLNDYEFQFAVNNAFSRIIDNDQ